MSNDNSRGEERLTIGDREAALDEVVAACSAAAATHHWVAAQVRDRDLGRALGRLAKARDADREALMDAMREAGMTPKAPDPERETLEALFEQAASLLSADERDAAIQRVSEHEGRLSEAIETALGLIEAPALRALLDDMATRDLPDALG